MSEREYNVKTSLIWLTEKIPKEQHNVKTSIISLTEECPKIIQKKFIEISPCLTHSFLPSRDGGSSCTRALLLPSLSTIKSWNTLVSDHPLVLSASQIIALVKAIPSPLSTMPSEQSTSYRLLSPERGLTWSITLTTAFAFSTRASSILRVRSRLSL